MHPGERVLPEIHRPKGKAPTLIALSRGDTSVQALIDIFLVQMRTLPTKSDPLVWSGGSGDWALALKHAGGLPMPTRLRSTPLDNRHRFGSEPLL